MSKTRRHGRNNLGLPVPCTLYDLNVYLCPFYVPALNCIDPNGGVSQGPRQQAEVAHGGENPTVTRVARERFGPVHILDLFGVTEQPSAAFNPLDGFDPSGLDVAEEAGTLPDILVFDESGQAGEAHC